jgi:hypothetical protein
MKRRCLSRAGFRREVLRISACARGAARSHALADASCKRIKEPEGEVTIAIVGKYTGLKDAYKSLSRRWRMAVSPTNVKVNLDWIQSRSSSSDGLSSIWKTCTASSCPAVSASAGPEGKIAAAKFRPRAQRALFRHLLRHADGGDRGGAEPGRARRPARPSSVPARPCRRRPDDRVDEGQPAREAHGRRRPRRHDAPGRSRRFSSAAARWRRSMDRARSRSATAIATK